ncbi:MAG: sigma factor-like helix-turn-helix DNA-binding protein [Bacillota bacterium]|nr:sigma factor-like helix-turn-helix DNA-binding protein [Bacillota bacterium]
MANKKLSLDRFTDELASVRRYNMGGDNYAERQRMKKLLAMAIKAELTDKQRFCLLEYYQNGKSMKVIAEDLSVHPSTVTRHIQAAVRSLKKVAIYA